MKYLKTYENTEVDEYIRKKFNESLNLKVGDQVVLLYLNYFYEGFYERGIYTISLQWDGVSGVNGTLPYCIL